MESIDGSDSGYPAWDNPNKPNDDPVYEETWIPEQVMPDWAGVEYSDRPPEGVPESLIDHEATPDAEPAFERQPWWFDGIARSELEPEPRPAGDMVDARSIDPGEATSLIADYLGVHPAIVADTLASLEIDDTDAYENWGLGDGGFDAATIGDTVTAAVEERLQLQANTNPRPVQTHEAQPAQVDSAVPAIERKPQWFTGISRELSGESEPRPDGYAIDARPVSPGEATLLIADFFETDPSVIQGILRNLGLDDTDALNKWSNRKDYRDAQTIGARITTAVEQQLRAEEGR